VESELEEVGKAEARSLNREQKRTLEDKGISHSDEASAVRWKLDSEAAGVPLKACKRETVSIPMGRKGKLWYVEIVSGG
jgi:hypothetical protein